MTSLYHHACLTFHADVMFSKKKRILYEFLLLKNCRITFLFKNYLYKNDLKFIESIKQYVDLCVCMCVFRLFEVGLVCAGKYSIFLKKLM